MTDGEARKIAKDISWANSEDLSEFEDYIFKVLLSYGQKRFEEGLRKAADICQKYVKDPYTSDTGTEAENIRNNILSLLPKEKE